jgi:hypothetical protein
MFKQGDIVTDGEFGMTGVLIESYDHYNTHTEMMDKRWKLLVMSNVLNYDESRTGDIVTLSEDYLIDYFKLVENKG